MDRVVNVCVVFRNCAAAAKFAERNPNYHLYGPVAKRRLGADESVEGAREAEEDRLEDDENVLYVMLEERSCI